MALAVYNLFRRTVPDDLAVGALAWWTLLTVAFTIGSPGASYFFAWPALAALAVELWRLAARGPSAWLTAAGVAVPLAVAIVVMAPPLVIFFLLAFRLDGLGVPVVGVMGIFGALIAGLVLPYLLPRGVFRAPSAGVRWLGPVAAGILAVVLAGVGAARLGYSDSYPRPDYVAYVLDADRGSATWQASDRESWNAPLLRDAHASDVRIRPFQTIDGWASPAPKIEVKPPRLIETGRSGSGDDSVVHLRLVSPRRAPAAAVEIHVPKGIRAATVGGRAFPLSSDARDGDFQLSFVGVPGRGLPIALTVAPEQEMSATVEDWTQGLPPSLRAPRRPLDTMPAALAFRADPTVVVNQANLRS